MGTLPVAGRPKHEGGMVGCPMGCVGPIYGAQLPSSTITGFSAHANSTHKILKSLIEVELIRTELYSN